MATKTRRSNKANRTIPSHPRPRDLGKALAKVPTGIAGFDVITGGGLPAGRPTLVCGSAGSGKTLLGMQFLVHGAAIGEPGVMISFEESEPDLAKNVASLGVDLEALVRRKKIVIDHVVLDRSEILETGGYDLSGLFVRLDHAIKSIGAKRIVLDTLEVLFASFQNLAVMRAEIERLFHWLKDRGITAIVTGERGDGTLTRNGLEEYVSDCVIVLDQRVTDQIATRRIRIVKYRGSSHGTNEYPFLVDEHGLSILPITGLGLDYPVSSARVLTGISALDEMLGGKGYFRGSSVLVSGMAGTGKSSVAASFVRASCERGVRCLYFALEEPAAQVVRNMRSIGINLARYTERGILRIAAARPTVFGLEQHLVSLHAAIEAFRPRVVIVDPVSSLVSGTNVHEVKSMLVRLFDYLKLKGITGLFTYLSTGHHSEETEIGVSSLIDTWLELREVEGAGERNRAMYIIKSRGMAHSNQVREFLITSQGLDLVDASIGPQGIMIGSARLVQEAEWRAANVRRQEESARRERALERQRKLVAAQIEALRSTLAAEEEEAASARAEAERQDSVASLQRQQMRQSALGRSRRPGSMRPA